MLGYLLLKFSSSFIVVKINEIAKNVATMSFLIAKCQRNGPLSQNPEKVKIPQIRRPNGREKNSAQ